jgi:hypothetical protein
LFVAAALALLAFESYAACPDTGEGLCMCAATNSVASGAWDNPSTWEGGAIPATGNMICIKPGHTVTLNVDTPSLGGLVVHGILTVPTASNRNLTAKWIMVHGVGSEFRVGTEATPYTGKATITLTGTDETENVTGTPPLASGTKFLMAMDGGRIELHGSSRSKTAWTKLGSTASPGASSITLSQSVNWTPGDVICIAPTAFNPNEAESVTVTSIVGNVVHFTPALQFEHWGQTQTIDGKVVDERAEVGLLTRNIVIRGAADSDASKFGAHTMIMPGGVAHIEGVEFTKTGQAGHKGRYSLHWHWVDRQPANGVTGYGQYVKNSSFHHAFQRAVNVHATNGVLVENNVAYRVQNHIYVWSEDGDEVDNVFTGNLGILALLPPTSEIAFPLATQIPEIRMSAQNEDEASVFWGRNARNFIVGNHAAGAQRGNGFHFDIEHLDLAAFPDGNVVDDIVIIENNVAHSLYTLWKPVNVFNPHMYNHVAGFGFSTNKIGFNVGDGYIGEGYLLFKNNLAYKCMAGGLWLDGVEHATDNVIANSAGGFHVRSAILQRNTIIGYTNNARGDVVQLSQSTSTRVPVGIGFPKFSDPTTKVFRASENTFIDVVGAFKVVDNTGFGKAIFTANNRFLGSTSPRFLTLLNVESPLIDLDGQLSQTGVPTLIQVGAINGSSVLRNDLGGNANYPVYATPLLSSGLFRAVITSPAADGTVTVPNPTITFQLYNAPAAPNLALRIGTSNPVEIPIANPASGSQALNGLSEGTYTLALLDKSAVANDQVLDRIYFHVGGAPQTPVTLSPTDDTYASSSQPSTNYGSNTALRVSSSQRSYLKFDLTSAPSTVGQAKLRVTCSGKSGSPNVTVSGLGDAWAQGSLTWSNAPAPGAPLNVFVVNSTGPNYYEIDVTAYIEAEKAGDGFASFVLTTTASSATLRSQDNSSGRPELYIAP